MSEPFVERTYEEQLAALPDAQCIYGIYHKITNECIYVGQCTGKAGSLEVGRWGQHATACFSREKWNRAVYVRMRRDTLRVFEVRVLEEYESEQLSIYELCVREQHYLDELNPPCNMRRAFDANVARRERNARRYRERKDREREAARGEGQPPPNTTTLEQYGFQVLKSS